MHPSFLDPSAIADPTQELPLISNSVLRVSLSDFELPLRVGRLKGNYASCLARRRRKVAAAAASVWEMGSADEAKAFF